MARIMSDKQVNPEGLVRSEGGVHRRRILGRGQAPPEKNMNFSLDMACFAEF